MLINGGSLAVIRKCCSLWCAFVSFECASSYFSQIRDKYATWDTEIVERAMTVYWNWDMILHCAARTYNIPKKKSIKRRTDRTNVKAVELECRSGEMMTSQKKFTIIWWTTCCSRMKYFLGWRETISGVSIHKSRGKQFAAQIQPWTENAWWQGVLRSHCSSDITVSLKATSMARARRFCREWGSFRLLGTSADENNSGVARKFNIDRNAIYSVHKRHKIFARKSKPHSVAEHRGVGFATPRTGRNACHARSTAWAVRSKTIMCTGGNEELLLWSKNKVELYTLCTVKHCLSLWYNLRL